MNKVISCLETAFARFDSFLTDLLDYRIQLNSRKKWFLFYGIVLAVLAVLSFQCFANACLSGSRMDSELCLFTCSAQQMLDPSVHGPLHLNYNRALIEVLLCILPVMVGGYKLFLSIFIGTFFLALFHLFFGLLISLEKDENGEWAFNVVYFLLFSLLSSCYFYVNLGHECTFALYAILLFLIIRFPRPEHRIRMFFAAFFLSALCFINDDFFLIVLTLPITLLAATQFLFRKKINFYFFPVVLGTGAGGVALSILVKYGAIAYPKVPIRFTPVEKLLGPALEDMLLCYVRGFKIAGFLGHPLKSLQELAAFPTFCLIFAAVLISFIVWVTILIKDNFRNRDFDLVFILLCVTVLVPLSFWLVDSPTKSAGNGVHYRYIYSAVISLIFLLCLCGRIFFRRTRMNWLFALCVLTITVCTYIDLIRKYKKNALSQRSKYFEAADILKRENISTAYAEYWDAYAIWAASRDQVKVYPVHYHAPVHVNPARAYIYPHNFTRECHVFIIPLNTRFAKPGLEKTQKDYGKPKKTIRTKDYLFLIYDQNVALYQDKKKADRPSR